MGHAPKCPKMGDFGVPNFYPYFGGTLQNGLDGVIFGRFLWVCAYFSLPLEISLAPACERANPPKTPKNYTVEAILKGTPKMRVKIRDPKIAHFRAFWGMPQKLHRRGHFWGFFRLGGKKWPKREKNGHFLARPGPPAGPTWPLLLSFMHAGRKKGARLRRLAALPRFFDPKMAKNGGFCGCCLEKWRFSGFCMLC